MALWQQLKTGNIVPEVDEDVTMGLYTEINATAGKGVINNAIQQISKMWDEVEHSGGAIAWEWILRKSHHGARIQKAEERVDTIGSTGDPAALVSACKAWVAAWRDGIEAWKKIKTTAKSWDGRVLFAAKASQESRQYPARSFWIWSHQLSNKA